MTAAIVWEYNSCSIVCEKFLYHLLLEPGKVAQYWSHIYVSYPMDVIAESQEYTYEKLNIEKCRSNIMLFIIKKVDRLEINFA